MVLPTFASSCIAPDRDGINAFLFGVSSPGTLEAHRIILSDPLSPTSILISTTSSTETVQWDPSSSLGCYPYLGDAPSSTANSTVNSAPFPPPITIIQFGNTLQTQFYPNGTWLSFGSTTETSINYLSPKLFSLVGSTNGWNWILARTVGQPISWRHIRIGTKTEAGSLDLTIAGSEPLLSVGAIAPDVNNFGNGLFLSIDQSGSTGTVYRSTGNKRPAANLTATDTLVTLGKPTPLNMGNITLTVNAVPVTSAFAAFILDKNEQGTISVYSIDPRISTFTLGRTLIKGISPLFQSSQSFTSLNSKIVVYGGAVPNAIHIFDVISGTWTGPALVDSSVKSTSKGLSIGVIGGIAAAAVIVLIIGGFAIWRIRRQRRSTITSTAKDFTNAPLDDNIKVPIKDETIDLSALNNKNQPKLDEHKETSESFATLTQSIAPSSMPGTPASQHRRHSNHKRPEKVSRHASAYSMRSERSASHISLFSANSTIYLAGPATIIPPNPTVPSAYSAVNLQQLQNAAAVYRSTSAPGTPNPRSATPPSRKGSIYQVAVPNDYDDRQPLHHHETSEERQAYLQMSAKSTPDGSPASINGLQPLETASSTLDGSHVHSRNHSQSDTSGASYPRPSFSSSSQSASPKPGRPSTSTLDGESQPQYAIQQNQQVTTSSSRSSSRPRRKKTTDSNAPLRSPTSPTSPKELSSPSSQRHADHRDSGSYKIEYRDASHRQLQNQQHRLHNPSNPASPTTPTSPYTPTTPQRLASPSSVGYPSPSSSPSDSNTHFRDAFPMPPKMVVPKPHKRTAPAPSDLSSSFLSNNPNLNQPAFIMSGRQQFLEQQQRQQQQQRQWQNIQQYDDQTLMNQQGNRGSVVDSVGTMSPRTPMLVSLPRPIPRERDRDRGRDRD